MKKYGVIWLSLFLFMLYMRSTYFYQAVGLCDTDNLLAFRIALIFSTQITGFLYFDRKMKDLQKKDSPQDEETPQE